MPNPEIDSDMKMTESPASRPCRIACIGEVMIELSPLDAKSALIGVAGDTFNTAVYLARLLGERAEISYVTAIGTDLQSARIIAALEHEGIDTALVERMPDEYPGLYMISLDAQGERSFSYWRSAAAARQMFGPRSHITPADIAGFDIVYLSAISLAILSQEARDALFDGLCTLRAAGAKIGFDSNYRPRLWPDVETARREVMRFWGITDIALPSVDDEMALFGDADAASVMRRLAGAGVAFGALKRGASGPVALDGSGQELGERPAARVVDTTAAGDSFNAGFIAAHVQGGSIAEAMSGGDLLARHVIGHPGAIVPLTALAGAGDPVSGGSSPA